jgi:hypothetical protein
VSAVNQQQAESNVQAVTVCHDSSQRMAHF